jgi:DegV family protein with EDD domain
MVKIIADTTSSIPVDVAKQLGVTYIPQIIIFGNESYRDDTELDSATFLNKLRASTTLPKTAAPPPEMYVPIYQEFLDQGHSIIVICPSSEVSGTYRSAIVAAQDFPGADIRIIDTRTIAGCLASLVIKAVEWANQGLDAATIEQKVIEMASRGRVYFLVNTLEYLHKGGRIGGAKALIGSLLQIKPILTIKNGRIEPVENQRTKRNAVQRIKDLVYEQAPHGLDADASVAQGDAEEEATEIARDIAAKIGVKSIPVYNVPAAILVHGGPGVMAVFFFVK